MPYMDKAEYIDYKVKEYAKENPWIDANGKSTLRAMLSAEHDFWERYEGREEVGHSHSAVGNMFNMGTN